MSQTMEESEGGQYQQVTYDECFDLLSNHRRRYTLHYLQQNGGEASLGDLSERVAAWENEIPMEELSYDERKRVYTSLQQVHLPRMDDAGVVTFDDREGTVAIGPAAEELDIYLEIVEGRDVPWSAFYLGLAVLNALVVGAVALGVPGLGAVPNYGLAVFAVTTFGLTGLVHAYYNQARMRLDTGSAPSTND